MQSGLRDEQTVSRVCAVAAAPAIRRIYALSQRSVAAETSAAVRSTSELSPSLLAGRLSYFSRRPPSQVQLSPFKLPALSAARAAAPLTAAVDGSGGVPLISFSCFCFSAEATSRRRRAPNTNVRLERSLATNSPALFTRLHSPPPPKQSSSTLHLLIRLPARFLFSWPLLVASAFEGRRIHLLAFALSPFQTERLSTRSA